VLVDTVDTQIASFKVKDAQAAADAANKAVADDVAESVPASVNPKIKAALDKKNPTPEPEKTPAKEAAPAVAPTNPVAEPSAEQIAAIGDITIEVPTENGSAKMTVNATKALAAIDERMNALEMVKRCLA
jgi:flagellar motor switch/type III secretory pathway protein FliN